MHSLSLAHHSSRSARHSSPKTAAEACWSCGLPAILSKLVCEECFKEAARDRVAESQQVEEYIRRAVTDGLKEVPIKPSTSPPPEHNVGEAESSLEGEDQEESQ